MQLSFCADVSIFANATATATASATAMITITTLRLDSFPELAEKGSFCPSCVYTSDDVRTIVEYARLVINAHRSDCRPFFSRVARWRGGA